MNRTTVSAGPAKNVFVVCAPDGSRRAVEARERNRVNHRDSRMWAISLSGGAPNIRRYSRLNWEGLS